MTEPVATPGENAYLSLEDASAIAATMLFADAWNAATDLARTKALITATSLLDRMRWQGKPLAPTQSLAWPRIPEHAVPGYPLATETPPAIAKASVELAAYLLQTGAPSAKPVQQQMLGDSMVMYFPTISDEFPKHVRRLIEPYLRVHSANVAEVQF
jgi:hypothetical protein